MLIVSLGVTDSFFSTSPSRIQKCTFLTILQVVQVHLYLCCKYVVCFLHVGPMNRDIYLSKALDTKARWEKFVLANHFVVYPKWKGDWKDKGRHSLIICLSQKPFKLFNKTFVSLDGAIETNVTTTFTRMRFQTTARSSIILISMIWLRSICLLKIEQDVFIIWLTKLIKFFFKTQKGYIKSSWYSIGIVTAKR